MFNSWVDWRGSSWIKEFRRSSTKPDDLPERGKSLTSKWPSLKCQIHFAMPSPLAFSPWMAQMFWDASAAFVLLLNSRRTLFRKCSFFLLDPPPSLAHNTDFLQNCKIQGVFRSTTLLIQMTDDKRKCPSKRYELTHQPKTLMPFLMFSFKNSKSLLRDVNRLAP